MKLLRERELRGKPRPWLGFTWPSAAALFVFAVTAAAITGPVANGPIHGLTPIVVALVVLAARGMARSLICRDG